MRVTQSTVVVGLLAAVVVACSGTPSATESADTGGGGGSGAETAAPVETAVGGGGGNTGGGSGQIHIDIGGPLPVTVDLPFFAFGSRFSGDPAGVQLNFATEGVGGIASITGVADGEYVFGYVGDELGANAQTCELSDWTIGDTSASGSFDCTEGFGTAPDGTYLTGVTMQGTFDAAQ